MALNKFQRSSLTFALSAKVAHNVVPSIYQNIVFTQTIGPIELILCEDSLWLASQKL